MKVKFVFCLALGLAQAEGWNRPGSFRGVGRGGGDTADLGGVLGCPEPAGSCGGAVGVGFGAVSKLDVEGGLLDFSFCEAGSGSSSFLALRERLLGLWDRSLLLVNLSLPRGGDDVFPSKGESCSGGRMSRDM